MAGLYELAGAIAERGFQRYAEVFRTQTTLEQRELENAILDSALDEAAIGRFQDAWEYDEGLRTWLQPAA